MRLLILPLLLLGASSVAGQARPAPSLVPAADGVHLRLPPDMLAALHTLDSAFVPFSEPEYLKYLPRWRPDSPHEALFAVIGDFNGDGRRDVVVDGHGTDSTRRVVLLSTPAGSRAISLHTEAYIRPDSVRYDNDRGYWVYLRAAGPGRIASDFEDGTLDLKTDAFEVEYFEKASVLMYWHEGAFREYTTGD